MMRNMAISFGFFLFIVLTFARCSSGYDAEELGKALEDRLTDALQFDGGEKKEGSPPEGSSGEDAPQISSVDPPDELNLGEAFIIAIHSNYTKPDKVDKAIVHVTQAKDHIVVTSRLVPLGDHYVMNLSGLLTADELLVDKQFSIELALQTEGGVTGEYADWRLKVLEEEKDSPEGEAIIGIEMEGETWHAKDRPIPSESEDAPQIEGTDEGGVGPALLGCAELLGKHGVFKNRVSDHVDTGQ